MHIKEKLIDLNLIAPDNMIRGTKLDTNIKENNTPRKIEKNIKITLFECKRNNQYILKREQSADGYGKTQRNQDKVKYRAIYNTI